MVSWPVVPNDAQEYESKDLWSLSFSGERIHLSAFCSMGWVGVAMSLAEVDETLIHSTMSQGETIVTHWQLSMAIYDLSSVIFSNLSVTVI